MKDQFNGQRKKRKERKEEKGKEREGKRQGREGKGKSHRTHTQTCRRNLFSLWITCLQAHF